MVVHNFHLEITSSTFPFPPICRPVTISNAGTAPTIVRYQFASLHYSSNALFKLVIKKMKHMKLATKFYIYCTNVLSKRDRPSALKLIHIPHCLKTIMA